MNQRTFRSLFVFLALFIGCLQPSYASFQEDTNPILLISSYNPEVHNVSKTMSDFMDEFRDLGGTPNVLIETMNCKSFNESALWKERMKGILKKYQNRLTPQLIVLIGQEAWASYLEQEDSVKKDIPVICGLVSDNTVDLPSEQDSLSKWNPDSRNSLQRQNATVKGGVFYSYDVKKNVALIKQLYPETENVAFISDNTYGGVSMQALVSREMKAYPELNLILLDGRKHTINQLLDQLTHLPEKTVILMGTWRIGADDRYFMRNAPYMMMEVSGNIPVFSMASVALGYWAIGGVVPNYQSQGKKLAKQAFELLRHPEQTFVEKLSTHTVFDVEALERYGVDRRILPKDAEFINEHISFFHQHFGLIIGVLFVVLFLTSALITVAYFYLNTRRMKDELLKSEAQLRLAKEDAEESNRLKTAFLANMSHEIRTPLNAIVGFSDILVMGDPTPEERMNYSEIIQTNSELLLRLIGDILELSRMEADRVKLQLELCDVISLCQYALTSVEHSTRSTNKFHFVTTLQALEMRTDKQRVQQVLINLLTNANKFTEEGDITLELTVHDEMAYFAVTDTGCGIPKEKQNKVFERFEKLDEYARGTGLGLAICKLTVEKLGGEIWVDADYTGGSRFIFTHPTTI